MATYLHRAVPMDTPIKMPLAENQIILNGKHRDPLRWSTLAYGWIGALTKRRRSRTSSPRGGRRYRSADRAVPQADVCATARVPLPNGQQIARIVDAYRVDSGDKRSGRRIVADAIEIGRHKLMLSPSLKLRRCPVQGGRAGVSKVSRSRSPRCIYDAQPGRACNANS